MKSFNEKIIVSFFLLIFFSEHLQNVDKECERLREELTHLREELATSVKYRAKMENVLKQASDSIAIVLSVNFQADSYLWLNFLMNPF